MDAQTIETLLAVLAVVLGVGMLALGVGLLMRGRRRGPDGGRGSAMLALGITALLLGSVLLVPTVVLLLTRP